MSEKSDLYYPQLKNVDPSVHDAVRLLYDAVYHLSGQKGQPAQIMNSAVIQGGMSLKGDGNILQIEEVPDKLQSSKSMGVASLTGGTATVKCTLIRTMTRVQLTAQDEGAGTPGHLCISARQSGESFTIKSSSATDDRKILWLLIEPQGLQESDVSGTPAAEHPLIPNDPMTGEPVYGLPRPKIEPPY